MCVLIKITGCVNNFRTLLRKNHQMYLNPSEGERKRLAPAINLFSLKEKV